MLSFNPVVKIPLIAVAEAISKLFQTISLFFETLPPINNPTGNPNDIGFIEFVIVLKTIPPVGVYE
jgi:hypothetical protein